MDLVHLKQKKGWRLNRAIIIIYTNFFLVQQEYIGIILPSKRITVINLKQYTKWLNIKNLIGGIRSKEGH